MELYEGTFLTLLRELRQQYNDKPALCCEGQSLSFFELLKRTEKSAVQLLKNGFSAGEKVVLWGYNSIEWVIAFLAVMSAGGTAVLMNYGIHAEEAGSLAAMVKAERLLYGTLPTIPGGALAIRCFGEQLSMPENRLMPFSSVTEAEEPDEAGMMLLVQAEQQIDVHSSQVIIYTTGTIARPKAVQLSAFSILNDAKACYELLQNDIGASVCNALPLFHSYGLLILFAYLSCGRTVHLTPVLKPDKIAGIITRNSVEDMASVGTVYEMLTRLPAFNETIAGRLNIGIVGGGVTSPAELIRLESIFGGTKILCGYGQTECSPVISVEKSADSLSVRAHSVGHILPGLTVRIFDSRRGFLPLGETGEIVVKGYCTMNGYEGVTGKDSPFDAEGWLHTGDIGYITEGNILHLAGRIKEIIVRCGENISPAEIEKALLSNENVLSVKVLGVPHAIWGESVEACVILKEPLPSLKQQQTAVVMQEQLRKKLSSYKVPSHIFFFDSFPLAMNGKLDRNVLLSQVKARLDLVSS